MVVVISNCSSNSSSSGGSGGSYHSGRLVRLLTDTTRSLALKLHVPTASHIQPITIAEQTVQLY